jgi:hypothetical protein
MSNVEVGMKRRERRREEERQIEAGVAPLKGRQPKSGLPLGYS